MNVAGRPARVRWLRWSGPAGWCWLLRPQRKANRGGPVGRSGRPGLIGETGFVGDGRLVSDGAVQPSLVVLYQVNQVKVAARAAGPGGEMLAVDRFAFEPREKCLGHGVVVRIADGAHRLGDPQAVTQGPVLDRSVLGAAPLEGPQAAIGIAVLA